MLLLQKAKDAKRIYAEVVHVKSEFTELLETEVGPKFGFCRDSQVAARFMNEFYTEAGVPPHAVEYVEAFGAAGSEADKEELEAIETVFCKERHEPLLVGSVMSNIGYTQAASGISAITKVILGYQRAELAANMHCTTPRQDIEAIRDGRMKVVTEHTPINPIAYVAVNSNAVTGINAHALLKGYYKPKDRNRYKCNFPRLVTISARQDINIQNTLNDLKNRPIDPEEIALFHNIHKHRISGYLGRGYIILDTDEEQKTVCLEETVAVFDDTKRPLWYVYSGMGSQWAGMGVHLMRIPIFAAAIERCRIALEPKGIDIVHIITSPDKTIFDNILNSFVGIAAIQIGLTDVLKSIGLEPDKVIGHSVGELGCAYADGCFTAEEMILSAYSRGLVSIQTPFIHGSMAAVGLGCEKVLEMLPPEIEVACHNSSESSTISGPSDIMKKFVAKLRAEGIFAKEVPCSNIAYHSRYIAEAGPGLLKYLSEIIKDPKERSERWVSTSVPQEKWGEPTAKYSSAEYHTNNLLNPVLFEETAQLIPTNAVLVEIAPHGLLQAILKRSMPSCNNIPLTRRGHPDNAIMVLDAIGKLFIDGYNLDIAALYPTIQFPVSTNTPMLSHFVEWAHTEKWNVPLYKKGSTQKNPICNFVPSIFDDEHSYLQGHVLRGKNPLPFAAAIEAVWDTYAMIQGSPRRQLQVELRDVCLFVQPPLHATRATRLRVYYFRGSGKFEVHNEMGLVASGFIDKGLCLDMEHFRSAFESKETMDLVSDDVYQLFHEKDYQYEGEFRSIHRANSSFTEAQIIWKNNWVTLLDGMLQLDNLRQSHSSFSTPTKIRRIMIDNNRVTDDNIIKEHDKKLLVAQVFEKYDYMRCGGILLESIRYQEISITDEISANLEIVEFVPHFDADIDTAVAWKVYLQIVSENINKGTINIVGITNQAKDTFCDLKVGLHSIAGISFNYSEISTDKMLTLEENFLSETDLVLVQNLSLDEHMGQILYRVLKRDTFIVNREETVNDRVRPSALYSVLSSHSINNTKLELLKWRPTHVASESAVGIWGGEYYLPCPEVKAVENRMVLQSGHVGDINSMFWTETSDVENSKLKVVVHYAALSNLDMQKATSVVPVITDHLNSNCYGMDFSGVTETGERVMGLLPRGAASTTVLAIPELVWPVPKHWTLEDAVTIPSAFAHAYYILRQKMDFIAHKHSILIHGGAGALGQALISIALSTGSEVFTTVSDISKKRFLTRLFPQLKEDHIFNSRDPSFSDMVILQTNGKGCSVVVTAAKGELKEMYCKVCKHSGFVVDVDQINSQENFTYKMFYLTRGRNYARVNFNDLFSDPEAIKAIQTLMSEGIARGFVRPLSRVIYDAVDVPRALNLLASSAHRGRVLLRMHQKVPVWQSRVTCSPALSHVVVCADEIVGIQLSDRLVRRGAKKLLLHICSSSGYLRQKIRSWEKNGVNVQIATADLDTKGVTNLLNVSNHIGPVEGIYMIVNNCHGNKVVDYLSTLTNLDLVSRRLCPSLRYFAVINLGSNIGRKTCLERSRLGLPATTIDLYAFSNSDEAVSGKLTWRSLIDATEAAVCSAQVDVAAFPQRRVAKTVTEQIADLAGIQLSDDPEMTYLVNPAKVPIIQTFLRTMHNVPIDAEDLITLTAAKLRSIEEYLGEEVRKELHGLGTFYSCEHFDELKGTIPVVPLQTLTEAEPQDYEYFDVTKRYVCIVPGLEGHYARFRLMCERFKTGAVVLQPSLDCPYDTAEQTADKYAQLLRDKVNIQDNFYLVGYESGVLVVLELAAILEGCGLKGTVFCIGGAPEEFQATLKHELREYQSDEELQNAVIRHMFVLMKGDDDGLDEVLEKVSTFKERIDVCVRLLLGRVPHSAQYAKTLILSAYTRIKLALQYKPQPRQLNSRVILLHSPSMILEDPRDTPVTLLQQYSKQPVVVHELHEPLAHAALDLRISAIINTYFDKNIKEAYEKANLCENHSFLGDLCSATQYFDWS
ncbi:fatty acid synthase-like [Hyposmocoma kahamanoa]|uniref:fatty acid synthase-like n=1 Tax=Hyposmocoma kahamanoa TaxID=1477025 RepID=UPI000E6D683D|nr:fatty acid synthase-like [Hyposmocoma kahamanoa]